MDNTHLFRLKPIMSSRFAAADMAVGQPVGGTVGARPERAGNAGPLVKYLPAVRIEQVKFINPDLAKAISEITASAAGRPRSQLTVPVCPTANVTDQLLFEDAADPAGKFFLPRYRIVTANGQYQISLAPSGQDWSLTIHLEKYPAPEIAQQVRGAKEFPHSISVILTHKLRIGGTDSGVKELDFQEVSTEGAGIKVALRLASLPERDRLYQALTDTDYNACLTVRRMFHVAVPASPAVPASGSIVSSGTTTIKGTWGLNLDSGQAGTINDIWWEQRTQTARSMVPQGRAQIVNLGLVNFDAVTPATLRGLKYSTVPIPGNDDKTNQLVKGDVFAVLTQHGNYSKVQVLGYGYDIQIRWVTFSPGGTAAGTGQAGGTHFNEITSVLDNVVDPSPFIFPPALDGYIFRGVSATPGQTYRLTRRVVGTNRYYQDMVVQPALFYYLPDSFKIARIPGSPHLPFMTVRFVVPDDDPSPDHIQATISYAAIAVTDQDRLAADSGKLKELYLAGSLPAGTDCPVFEPLAVDPKRMRFLLNLPGAGSSSGPYQERKGAMVDLRTGIHDVLTLSMKDFQSLFEAMFSSVALVFDGRVEFDIGDELDPQSEVVPFVARMNDLAGELFDYEESLDETSGGVRATLKNAIESPLKIHSLGAELKSGDTKVPARIDGIAFDPPPQIGPKDKIQFVVAPASPLDGHGPVQALYDLDGVEVVPDKEAIWNAILDPHTSNYLRPIHIQTFKEIFDPPQDKPQDQILEIDIDLRRGSGQPVMARLSPSNLSVDIKLPVAISDFVLEREDTGQYNYRVTTIRRSQAKDGDWKTASRDTLWILSSEVN